MRFALCNEMFEGWPLERVCDEVAACGYEGIELAPFTLLDNPARLTEAKAASIGAIAERAGLVVSGFHWLLIKPDGLHVTTPDAEVRRRTTEFLRHLARMCAAMGGRMLVFGSPGQRDVLPGDTYGDAFGRARDVFAAVAETAGPLGVTLALEPLGADETNFMATTAQTVALIEAVDCPACRLHLDVKAMSTEPAGVAAIIERYARHLTYFHANDANRRGPGFGQTDFVPIFAALDRVGYDGWVSVEVFDYSPDPKTIARCSIEHLKSAAANARRQLAGE